MDRMTSNQFPNFQNTFCMKDDRLHKFYHLQPTHILADISMRLKYQAFYR